MRKIKELRKALGVKQTELADFLELQRSNYANIENGRLLPNNLDEIKKNALIRLFFLLDEKIENTETDLNYLKSFKDY